MTVKWSPVLSGSSQLRLSYLKIVRKESKLAPGVSVLELTCYGDEVGSRLIWTVALRPGDVAYIESEFDESATVIVIRKFMTNSNTNVPLQINLTKVSEGVQGYIRTGASRKAYLKAVLKKEMTCILKVSKFRNKVAAPNLIPVRIQRHLTKYPHW